MYISTYISAPQKVIGELPVNKLLTSLSYVRAGPTLAGLRLLVDLLRYSATNTRRPKRYKKKA